MGVPCLVGHGSTVRGGGDEKKQEERGVYGENGRWKNKIGKGTACGDNRIR